MGAGQGGGRVRRRRRLGGDCAGRPRRCGAGGGATAVAVRDEAEGVGANPFKEGGTPRRWRRHGVLRDSGGVLELVFEQEEAAARTMGRLGFGPVGPETLKKNSSHRKVLIKYKRKILKFHKQFSPSKPNI